MGGQEVEMVFTKPVSLQSELCNPKPPKDKLQRWASEEISRGPAKMAFAITVDVETCPNVKN